MEFACFCGQKAKSFKTKNKETIFMCGTEIDFKKMKAMREVLKMKASEEKEEALKQLGLGYNMN